MGKKKKQTTDPSAYAKPYVTAAANNLQTAIQNNAGNVQAITGDLNTIRSQLGERLGAGSDLTNNAKSYAANVLGGAYLGNNPYLDQMADLTRSNTMNTINSGFGRNGMAFGSDHSTNLGRGISEAELALRYGDYSKERDRMDSMAGQAGAIDTSDLVALPYYMQAAQLAAGLPTQDAQTYAQTMAGLMGNYTTSSQKTGGLGSVLGGALGLGLNAYGMGLFGGRGGGA